ncbi:Mite allergen Lep d 7 [Sarcoptes scabiei]|uniref:Mite allergen Lep d 7 n=1 Tax=Sarcoptes scabiei TaxID=52283 RepID=A0A834VGE4_SARSC|nr:Mite allergen Lep d 7 [Sarcoptes scabiei]UXI16321.1 major abundant protein BTP1 [Sarcoptes scabiei]
MKSNTFCSFIIVSSIVFALTVSNETKHKDNGANLFIDQMLETVLKTQKSLDPLMIGPQNETINTKLGFINLYGYVELKFIQIVGLSFIHRNGDALLTNSASGAFQADLRLADSKMKLFTKLHFNVNNWVKDADLEIDIGLIDVHFNASIGLGDIKLNLFQVDQLSSVRFYFSGLGFWNPFANAAADLYVWICNAKTKEMISGMVEPIIEKELGRFFK